MGNADRAAAPLPGDELDLHPTGIAHGGFAVARYEGRVVFVADAIPGEPVRARILDSRASYSRAVALEPLEPSADRIAHVWPEAGIERDPGERAGGAEFGHIALARERALKSRVIAEAMARFAGGEPATGVWSGGVEAMPGDDENRGTRWRTRVTLHLDDEGRVGPYAARSHRVVPVATLPLAHADIEELAPLGGLHVGDSARETRGPGRIELVAPAELDTRMRVRLDRERRSRPPATITERVRGIEFALDDDGFWQVHRLAADALSTAVLALAADRLDPGAQHLDLYGGVGLFAAMLGDAGARRVESVESNARATAHARRNLAPWPGHTAVTARVDRYVRDLGRGLDAERRAALGAGTIVLDPPRSGAGREVAEALVGFAPAQIVYVACDPVALARDAGILRTAGYRLDALRALDLFPNTHHVECVARFVPEEAA